MKNLVLHKYLSINLFIYINFINFFNFLFFIYLIITGYQWTLHFLDNIFITWFFVSLIGIPSSGLLVLLEYTLRKGHIIDKYCDNLFTPKKIKIIYLASLIIFIAYFVWILYCMLPPSPAEIEAMRYD